MWVSGDCKEAFLCNKLYPNGGIRGDCRGRPDEIVSFDTVFADGIFSCQPDEGECPGTNCIKIGLPGKLILSKRKGLREVHST